MALNNFDEEDDQFNPDLDGEGGDSTPGSNPPETPPSNKNFLLAIGIIGVVLILALVLLLLVAPDIISQQRNAQIEQAAQINAANTATAMAATALAAVTDTPVSTAILTATSTPVIAVATSTPVVAGAKLSESDLATVQALQTEMAAEGGEGTITPTAAITATSTALPTTGFADEYGLPGLAAVAIVLIAVIFLSRRLRTSPR